MGFRDGLKELLSKTSRHVPPEQPPTAGGGPEHTAAEQCEHNSADRDLILALTMSLQERDVARKLANAESRNMASAKRQSIIDSVMGDGRQRALSYKLWEDNCLEYDDIVPDGFYDVWGDFGDVVPAAGDFPSLHELRSIPRIGDDPREVLLVDHSADPGLCTAAERLTERLNEDSSVMDKIKAIAEVVSSALGGSASTTKELYKQWEQASRAAKKRHRGIVVPLGDLPVGLYRHRALLFKVLADSIELPCRLVRAIHNVAPGGVLKAAALVRVDGKEMMVDLMRSPGRTVPFAVSDLTKLLATPSHSRTNSFNSSSSFAALANGSTGGGGPSALHIPSTVPDLMTFDSPLPQTLHTLPEQPSTDSIPGPQPSSTEGPGPPHEQPTTTTNGPHAGVEQPSAPQPSTSRPSTPAANSRPHTGRVASPSSPPRTTPTQADPWGPSSSTVIHSASSPQLAQMPTHTPTPPPSTSSNPFGSPQAWPHTHTTPASSAGTAPTPPSIQERRASGNPFAEVGPMVPLQLGGRTASTPGAWQTQPVLPNSAPPFGGGASGTAPRVSASGGGYAPPNGGAWGPRAPVGSPGRAAGGFVGGGSSSSINMSGRYDWSRLDGRESSTDSLRKFSDDSLGLRLSKPADDIEVFKALDPLRPIPPAEPPGGGPGMTSTASSRPSSAGMAAQRTQSGAGDAGGGGGKVMRNGNAGGGDTAATTATTTATTRPSDDTQDGDEDAPGSLAPLPAQPNGGAHPHPHPNNTNHPNNNSTSGAPLSQQLTVEMLEDDWEIDFHDIKLGSRIGIGSYGEVYRGVWRHTEVAVKKLLEQEVSDQTMMEFRREVAIMKRIRHPNIITFLGAVTNPPNMAIVTQFAARGSLFRMLHRCPHAEPLDERRRLRMARDIACGMLYLASCKPPIVHRDLKSPNILIDRDFTAKVCDFGLSRACQAAFMSNRTQAGTPEWTAPEVLRGEPYDLKSDVFSYGVVLWELATLQEPWTGNNAVQVIGVVGYGKAVLPIPEFVAPTVAAIIRDCFTSAAERPSFGEILERLEGVERLTTLQGGGKHAG